MWLWEIVVVIIDISRIVLHAGGRSCVIEICEFDGKIRNRFTIACGLTSGFEFQSSAFWETASNVAAFVQGL